MIFRSSKIKMMENWLEVGLDMFAFDYFEVRGGKVMMRGR